MPRFVTVRYGTMPGGHLTDAESLAGDLEKLTAFYSSNVWWKSFQEKLLHDP